jgi:hypothetical protein
MKTWWRGDIAPPFLTSALDGGGRSVLCPGRFTPREIARTIHWIGIWVNPRASLKLWRRICLKRQGRDTKPAIRIAGVAADIRTETSRIQVRSFSAWGKSRNAFNIKTGGNRVSTVFWKINMFLVVNIRRSRWPRGLRHELTSPAQTLGSWVRILLEARMSVFVYSVFVLSCV